MSDAASPIGWAGGRPDRDPSKDIVGVLSLGAVCALAPTCALSIAGVQDSETIGFGLGVIAAIALALHWRRKAKRALPVRIEGGAVHALEPDGRVRWSEPCVHYTELWLSLQRKIGTQFSYSFQLVHRHEARTVHFAAVLDGDEAQAVAYARSLVALCGGVALRDHRGALHPRAQGAS